MIGLGVSRRDLRRVHSFDRQGGITTCYVSRIPTKCALFSNNCQSLSLLSSSLPLFLLRRSTLLCCFVVVPFGPLYPKREKAAVGLSLAGRSLFSWQWDGGRKRIGRKRRALLGYNTRSTTHTAVGKRGGDAKCCLFFSFSSYLCVSLSDDGSFVRSLGDLLLSFSHLL